MFRIKLSLICILLLIALIAPVTAQPQETLAVLDFTTEAVSKTEMTAIVEFLSAELFNTRKYIVIDVSQRETILNEMEFSMQGCSDETCALEIGKMLSAELIVVGNLSKVGSRYLMSVKMLQTETSRTMGTANGKFGDLDELIDGLKAIALTLAGEETAAVTAAAPPPAAATSPAVEPAETQQEDTPVPSAAPQSHLEPEISVKPDETSHLADFNLVSFIGTAIGTVGLVQSGVFSSFGLTSRLASLEAYDAYLSAITDPAALYSGDGDGDYEHYYNEYENMAFWGYISGGVGGSLSIASVFLGDSYLSFGGKLTVAAGTFALAAGNIAALMSANTAIGNRRLYDDYLSAGDEISASSLFAIYEDSYNSYVAQQYLSYGLWGAGGILTIGSYFIPGEKTTTASSFLEKIIMGVGYLCLAGGNFTSSVALNERFYAENAWDEYMASGSNDESSNLYTTYEEFYDSYQRLTYTSYGLWGAGAMALAAALFIPENSDSVDTAKADYDFALRPSLAGFGVEVEIKLK